MMMNKLMCVLAACTTLCYCAISQGRNPNPDVLRLLYKEMISTSDPSVAKSFFYYFPSEYRSYVELYGMGSPLYYEALDHIVALKHIDTTVELNIYVNKLVELSLGGEWDADGVSYLQSLVRNKLKSYPSFFEEALLSLPPSDVYSFFYFYLDDVHLPSDKKVPEELEEIKESNSMLSRKIEEALEAVYRNN